MKISFSQKEEIGVNYVLNLLKPYSGYGAAMLRVLPCYTPKSKNDWQKELENIEKILHAMPQYEQEFARIERLLQQIKNISATFKNCMVQPLNEVELFEIKRFVIQLRDLKPIFETINEYMHLHFIYFEDVSTVLSILDPEKRGVASFYISTRHSSTLAMIRKKKKELEQKLRECSSEKEEILAARRLVVEQEQTEEQRVCVQLTEKIKPYILQLEHNATAIARFDISLQKAYLAKEYQATKPVLSNSLYLENMFNPMVADVLAKQEKEITPVTVCFEKGCTVITGANMGGKSVTLKTAALNVYLMQHGFYAFASKAETPLFDSMHLLLEDAENVQKGLSSFGGEIVRLNEVLARETLDFSFIVLDEFARGTNPQEGTALAQAVTEWLARQQDISVLTTHFDHVSQYATAQYQVAGLKNLKLSDLQKQLVNSNEKNRIEAISRCMDYSLLKVTEKEFLPHEALNICKLLGLNDGIVAEVEKKLLTFAKDWVK